MKIQRQALKNYFNSIGLLVIVLCPSGAALRTLTLLILEGSMPELSWKLFPLKIG